MDYRILHLIQQDRSAGIHDPEEVQELDPRIAEVFQWLEERKNEAKAREAADYDLDEAIKAVGGHQITEARGQKDRGRGMGPVPVGRQSQQKTYEVVFTNNGKKFSVRVQAMSKEAAKEAVAPKRGGKKVISAIEVKRQ